MIKYKTKNVATRIGYLCGIASIFGSIFSGFKIHFAIISVLSFCIAYFYNLSESKKEEEKKSTGTTKILDSIVLNHPDGIIIKSLADNSEKFKTVSDIVSETGRSANEVDRCIDWMFMQGFVSEEKIRSGKTYILTPQGRETFKQQIEK